MADDDQTALDEEQRSFLLTGVEEFEDTDLSFSAADGINAGNLSRSVVGTIGFALAAAATLFVQGVTEAWTRLIDGLTGFLGGTERLVDSVRGAPQDRVIQEIPGLIGTLAEGVTSAMRGAWGIPESGLPDSGVGPGLFDSGAAGWLFELGIPSWLFALGLVLVTFYAAARGLDAVTEVLRR